MKKKTVISVLFFDFQTRIYQEEYHNVLLCILNDIHKCPLDIDHKHSIHYRMDWVDELNNSIEEIAIFF